MKQKTLLKASIQIDGFPITLSCRRIKGGYAWYADGAGATNMRVDEELYPYETLIDAKNGLITTYPPLRYGMVASWLR